MSRWLPGIVLGALVLTAVADEPAPLRPSAEAMAFDGLFRRPLALVGTALGAGLFVATLPFSALGGNVEQAGEALVLEPARDTFSRCLGCPRD